MHKQDLIRLVAGNAHKNKDWESFLAIYNPGANNKATRPIFLNDTLINGRDQELYAICDDCASSLQEEYGNKNDLHII